MIGASDVRLQRPQRVAAGRAHDGLRTEVKDGVRLAAVDRALDVSEILEAAVDHLRPRNIAAAQQLGLRIGVLYQADHLGAARQKILDQPGTDHAGGSCDEDAPASPGVAHADHVFHGAVPEAHSSSSRRTSRTVSMHCQRS